MYCKKCGAEIVDESNFCPECGEVLDDSVEVTSGFDGFAKVAKVFGLLNIILSWTMIIPYMLAIPGIVFGSIGAKSPSFHKRAKFGRTASIVGLVIAFVVNILIGVILALIEVVE